MNITEKNGNIYVSELYNFNLAQTLDCGQAFRWAPVNDPNGAWHGIAHGRELTLEIQENTLILYNTSLEDFNSVWCDYFDLKRDYGSVITACEGNPLLKNAAEYGAGIRILNQDPWEALCSFIISQNNNIPRIKGIITRLCEGFGTRLENGYSFPEAKVLAALTVEDLAPLRSGFRAKYILDAAQKVAKKEVELDGLYDLSYEQAKELLMIIKGVGEKVADCTLLFGVGKIDAFPKDVWIKRVMSTYFPNGLPNEALPFAGIIQQYLFYYARTGEITF